MIINYDLTNGTFALWFDGMPMCGIDANYVNQTFTQFDLGQLLGGTNVFGGTINEIRYYNTSLSDENCRILTGDVEIDDSVTYDASKHIYMFLGQSNNVGQAQGTPVYSHGSNIFKLSNAMTVAAYTDPLSDSASSRIPGLNDLDGSLWADAPTNSVPKIGYAGYFADNLYNESGQDVMVCPANLAGSSFDGSTPTWDTKRSTYRTSGTKFEGMMATVIGAVEQIQLAKQRGPIAGVIWGQGEGDVVGGTTQAEYVTFLTDLITLVRGAIRQQVKWFNCSMPDYTGWATQAAWEAVADAQAEVADDMTDVFFVIGTNIAGTSGDEVHYDLTGAETVGKVIAAEVFRQEFDIQTFLTEDGTPRTINVGGQSYTPKDQGFLWALFDVDASSGSERYPVILNQGSSTNTAAIFLDNNIDFPGSLYRASGGGNRKDNLSVAGGLRPIYGTKQFVGLSWDNSRRTGYVYSHGYSRTRAQTADLVNFSSLELRDYSGGDIYAVEMGNQYLTPEQMEARMIFGRNRHHIRGGGQSLRQRWINSDETSTDIGYETFMSRLQTNIPDDVFTYQNSAVSGSGLMKANDSTTSWWDETTGSPGPSLLSMYSSIDATGIAPTIFTWSQGQNDALDLDESVSPTFAEYKTSLKAMFDHIRTTYGDVQIFIDIIGRKTSGNSNVGGTQGVRNAQLELIEENDYIHFGAEEYIAPLYDNEHPLDAGYVTIATNGADSISEYLGATLPNAKGPRITSATRNGQTITVNTDDTTLTGSEGFVYIGSDDTAINISSQTVSNGVITLTLDSAPIDTNGTLYYIYDLVGTETLANLFTGLNSKPLRSYKTTL
jgi:hypothetical protein